MRQFCQFLTARCLKLDSFLKEFNVLSSPNGEITTSYWYDNLRAQRVTYEEHCIIIVRELKQVLEKLQLYNDDALVELNEQKTLEEFKDFFNQLKEEGKKKKKRINSEKVSVLADNGTYFSSLFFICSAVTNV